MHQESKETPWLKASLLSFLRILWFFAFFIIQPACGFVNCFLFPCQNQLLFTHACPATGFCIDCLTVLPVPESVPGTERRLFRNPVCFRALPGCFLTHLAYSVFHQRCRLVRTGNFRRNCPETHHSVPDMPAHRRSQRYCPTAVAGLLPLAGPGMNHLAGSRP